MTFQELKKNLKKDFTSFPKMKVAVLGDSATQLLCIALRGQGFEAGLDIGVLEGDYDRIYETAIDPGNAIYSEDISYIFIVQSTEKLQKEFYSALNDQRGGFAEEKKKYFETLVATIGRYTKAKIIFFNFPEINDAVFGGFSSKTPFSFLHQLRKINVGMQDIATENKNVFIADILSASNAAGAAATRSAKWYITTQNVFQLDFLAAVAKTCTDMLAAFAGKFKKCLVLDLDNTMWGGIIGDDGIDHIQLGDLGIGKAFTQLQYWVKELKNRGVIIVVCSKNDEHTAKEVFEKHPDMILRTEDLSLFVANWSNKGDNIKYIQEVLNIGMDSLVFIDDNPFERNLVKMMHPEVTVPELPDDPADYLPFLQSLNLFETVSFTDEDTVRTKQYKEESQRVVMQQSFESVDEYLVSLQMEANIEGITSYNLGRCAQLTQRSNQFNLTTIRYSEGQLQHFIDEGGKALCISLKDKFGDYGLISLVLLEKKEEECLINTWIMSCRVLKRGVEELAVNEMVSRASAMGCSSLTGRYLPTPKNDMVKELYSTMGFGSANETDTKLHLTNFVPFKIHIKITNELRSDQE